jgi:hypothetical protein
LLPVAGKGRPILRPNGEDLGAACDELRIIPAQLRQMPAAERSGKSTQKHDDDQALAAKS